VIVFDEIDNIGQSDDILYGLPRARSSGYVDELDGLSVGVLARDKLAELTELSARILIGG